MALGPDVALFTICPHCSDSGTPDELVALDLRTGTHQVLARTQFRRGQLDWVETTGEWAVYTDQSREPSDSDPNVKWRLRALNVTTGQRRTLASSHQVANADTPLPRAGDRYAVWTAPDPSNPDYGEIRAARLSTGIEWTVRRHVRPEDLGVTDGRVAWSTANRQVDSVRLNGTGRVHLLHRHLADDARAGDAIVAWTQASHRNPLSNPRTLWVRSADGSHPAQLLRNVTAWRISVGNGFVAYLPNSTKPACATSFTGHTITFPGTGYVPTGTAAHGHHLAYATSHPNGSHITIHVATMTGK